MAVIADLDAKRIELNQAIEAYKQAVLDYAASSITLTQLNDAKAAAQVKGDELAKLIAQVKQDDVTVTNDDQLFSNPGKMTSSVRSEIASTMTTGQYKRQMIWVVDTRRNPVGYTDRAELALRGTANNLTVDWGDGTIEENVIANKTHTYATPGIYEIKLSGLLDYRWPTDSRYYRTLVDVKQWGNTVTMGRYTNFFRQLQDFTISATDLPTFSPGIDANYMFASTNFNGDISHWDVSNIGNMSYMFDRNPVFNQDIGNWDVSGSASYAGMFNLAESFDQDLSAWAVSPGATYVNFAAGCPIDGTAKMPNFT